MNSAAQSGQESLASQVKEIMARKDFPFAFACIHDCFSGAAHGRIAVYAAGQARATDPFTSVESAVEIINHSIQIGLLGKEDVEKLMDEIGAIPGLARTHDEFLAGQAAAGDGSLQLIILGLTMGLNGGQ